MTSEAFDGYANYETWNMTLAIGNDRQQYEIAVQCTSYRELITKLAQAGYTETLDGVKYSDPKIDEKEIDEWLKLLKEP